MSLTKNEISHYHNYLNAKKKRKRAVFIIQLSLFFLFLLLWELSSQKGWIDPLIFSRPSMIGNLFIEKIADGSLLIHLQVTVIETILGFTIGTCIGIILAAFLWWFPFFQNVSDPYLVILNAMPKVALGPIIIVIFGPSYASIITMGALLSVIITSLVVNTAFSTVDRHYLMVMQTFGATKWQSFKTVIFPASFKTMISTLKVNVGLSWVGVIVGEFLVAKQGLGYMIIYGFQVFHFTLVWLSLLLIGIVATCMYKIVAYLERKLVKNQ